MLESPEILSQEHREGTISPEKAAILIQAELMKRSPMDRMEWIEKHSAEFRELFERNKEKFVEMYRDNPETLYTFLEESLERKN